MRPAPCSGSTWTDGGWVHVRRAYKENGGELYLGPQGQILSESPATSRERASAANPVALTVAIVAAGASVLLAIFLIVAGAFVFRDAPGRSRGRRLHRIWAAVKIPVALAAAVGLWWMFKRHEARLLAKAEGSLATSE